MLERSPLEAGRTSLEKQLRPRLDVERHFARVGHTFRKSRFEIWFSRRIVEPLLRMLFQVLGLYKRGKRNALDVTLRRLVLSFDNLPDAFNGFQVLQISDLHIDKMPGLAEVVVPLVRSLRPDIVVFTGDYRYEIDGPCENVYPAMRQICSNLYPKQGCYGILGNHDAAVIALELQIMGVQMLINSAVRIARGDAGLWLIGVDDSFDYQCDDLDLAIAPVPKEAFKILLAHTPELYEAAAELKIDLYLCGHTHAGQIRVPGIGAIRKNARCPRAFVQDLWQYKNVQGYTTFGTGCSTLPIRFRCQPEIVMFELRKK